MKRWVQLLAGGAFAGAVFAVAAFAVPNRPAGAVEPAGLTALFVDSETGDWIGGGQSQYLVDQTTHWFEMYVDSPRSVRVAVHASDNSYNYFGLTFTAMPGETLSTGSYDRGMSDGTRPATFLATSGWHGCNKPVSHFTIHQLVYSSPTVVERFAATFEQHCDALPALFGEVHFHSAGVDMPALTVAPPSQSFSSSGASHSVAISNHGNVAQDIQVELHGANPDDFEVTGDCSNVAAGAVCTVQVTFDSRMPGQRTAELVVLDETLRARHSVLLTATGLPTTTVNLLVNQNPVAAGEPIMLHAYTGATSGTVEFLADNMSIGAAPVNGGGEASLTTTLDPGSYWVIAAYTGTATIARSESAPVQVTVEP